MSNSVENPKTLADSIRSFSEDWGIDAVIKENEYGFTAKIHDDIKDSDDMIVMADDILKRLFGKSVLQTANNQNGLDDIFSVSSVIDDWFINLVMIIGATHSNILISCCSTDSVSNNVVVSRMSSIL